MQALAHCPTCLGTGTEFNLVPVKDADIIKREILGPCPECHGTGAVPRTATAEQEAEFRAWYVKWIATNEGENA